MNAGEQQVTWHAMVDALLLARSTLQCRCFLQLPSCLSTMAAAVALRSSSTTMTMTAAQQLGEKACAYLTASTDPFHAVQNAVQTLEAAGYTRLGTAASALHFSNVQAGGKYYYTVQNNSTLVAFAVGSHFSASTGTGGFTIIGGHTDSPNLRVKPRSQKAVNSKSGCVQLGVECYGGGLWHTWFDRDLSLSGRVLVRSNSNNNIGGGGGANNAANYNNNNNNNTNKVTQRLIQLRDPVARVSTLCIHLQSPEERLSFAVNKEDHTSPTIASLGNIGGHELEQSIQAQINNHSSGCGSGDSWLQGQEPLLLHRIAQELNVSVNQIADFDLSLYDTQPATLGGMNREFLYSARLDNLATVFCAVTALSEHDTADSSDIAMIVCFDHEEVGSVSAQGAGSPILQEAVSSISAALHPNMMRTADSQQHAAIRAKSFILSIDQAHAVHPNYANKHESMHSPVMNGGIVIKSNSNQRYATNSMTAFMVREMAKQCNVPIQEFCGTSSLVPVFCFVWLLLVSLCVQFSLCYRPVWTRVFLERHILALPTSYLR